MSSSPKSNQRLDAVLMDISWLKTSEGIYRFSKIDALTPPDKEGEAWVLTVSGEPVFLDIDEAVNIEKLLKPCVDVRSDRTRFNIGCGVEANSVLWAILSQPSSVEPCFEYFRVKGWEAKIVSLLEKNKHGRNTYILYLTKDERREYAGSSIAECLMQGIAAVV
jgi:hypothetical protein